MRVFNWNCSMAFHKKLAQVRELDPDIMIIQECEAPDHLESALRPDYTKYWVGENRRKGLGVFVRAGLRSDELRVASGGVRYMLPIRVSDRLNLIAFWAMPNEQNRRRRYISQVWHGLRAVENRLNSNTLVIGDFNWNAEFKVSGPLDGTMEDVIELLADYRMFSAYHHLNAVPYGSEVDYTLYMYRDKNRGFHIDYAFLSEELLDSVQSFQIGAYEVWGGLSDHMPLILDLV